jgi:thymidylate kinase
MDKKKMHMERGSGTHIAIVGPCGSGKSTLVSALNVRGYDARQIAQEHSVVPAMWKKLTNPDILIYLDVSFQSGTRRKQFNWTPEEFEEQVRRLLHARQHCDIYVHTDSLKPPEVVAKVLDQL